MASVFNCFYRYKSRKPLLPLDAGPFDDITLDGVVGREDPREIGAVAIYRFLACLADRFLKSFVGHDRSACRIDFLRDIDGQSFRRKQAAERRPHDGKPELLDGRRIGNLALPYVRESGQRNKALRLRATHVEHGAVDVTRSQGDYRLWIAAERHAENVDIGNDGH